MFKKILIANRGEIALRVISACKELGVRTVAVYSEPDADSLHVRFADEGVCIGPSRSVDSYLNIPSIISAAEITGSDAIHPGYGFLAESSYLAEVCEACHIKFIGPSPRAIRLMGDKSLARRTMKKTGVPVLPGSSGVLESEEEALQLASDIKYPIMLKAAAGGGGRGMRIVRAPMICRRHSVPRNRRRKPRLVLQTSIWKNISNILAISKSRFSGTTRVVSCISAKGSAPSSGDTRSCSKNLRLQPCPSGYGAKWDRSPLMEQRPWATSVRVRWSFFSMRMITSTSWK